MFQVWGTAHSDTKRPRRFFLITLSHDNLENYYRTNFAMTKFHEYTMDGLENMLPWEREVYVSLVSEWVKEENERLIQQQKSQNQM